jgi:hypothetical protein
MALHNKKHQASLAQSPFEDPACLRLIHDYLGAGHYAFIAPVSKLWKLSYEATPSLKTIGYGFTYKKYSVLCDSKTTLFSSIFTSTPRVQLFKDSELPLLTVQGLQRLACNLGIAAGRFAELNVLQYTLDLGILNHPPLLYRGSALASDLGKLQWLHVQKRIPLRELSAASLCAAVSGSVNILQWLAEVCGSKVVHIKDVMTAACANGQIQTVQYLLRRRCECNVWDCCAEAARGGHLNLIKWMLIKEPFQKQYAQILYWNDV